MQKKHISTANHYKLGHKCHWVCFPVTNNISILSLYLLLNGEAYQSVIILIVLRYTVFMCALYRWSHLLKKDLLLMGPLTEISLIFIQCYLFFKNTTTSSKLVKKTK